MQCSYISWYRNKKDAMGAARGMHYVIRSPITYWPEHLKGMCNLDDIRI